MVSLYNDPHLNRMAAGPPKAKPSPSKTAIFIGVLVAFVLGALFAWFLSQWINVSSLGSVETSSTGNGVSDGGRGNGNGQQEKPGPGGQTEQTGQTGSGSGTGGKPNEGRMLITEMLLPKTLEPVRYDLELKTYLPGYETPISKEKNLTFDGKVAIEFLAHESVNKIQLNSLGLEFNAGKCSLVTSDQKTIRVDKVEIEEKLDQVVFHFKEKLPKGKLILTIVYNGKMSASILSGLYQTRYRQSDGLEKIAVVTQMEPMDARRMVPCYDEPEHKAIWKVSIIHPKGTSAISNGIEEGPTKETNDGFLRTTFIDTPKMSTYLLALMVSEFKYVEGHTKNGVRYRIWARPEAIKTTEYALMAGVKCLERLEDYFGVPFPLKKQDMVAVPDFAMGAMENWGLITYRETALLYDPQNYNYNNKQRVATVIAHELAHQWFGNLVTMKWWDDIWLNEGFASYVENIGVDMINDGAFEMEKQFISSQIAETLAADSMASSNPIIFDIEYKEEINSLFDAISYKKGGSVLFMINHLMGDAFEKGVTNYLKRYGYKNTVHSDLFREWDDVVPNDLLGPDGNRFNVTAFALRWTKQMGYPLLTMTTTAGNVRIEQQRFKLDPAAKEREKFANPVYGFKWDVPVWIQQGNQPSQLYWLTPEGFINLHVEPGVPVVMNADSKVIARTNYDEKGWDLIIDQLKKDNTIYSETTKYRIVSDVFTMAEVEKVPLEKALSLASYIVNEKSYLPWDALLSKLSTLSGYYGSMPEGREVDKYRKRLLEPIFKKIDITKVLEEIKDDASHTAKKLELAQWLLYCGIERSACKSIFKEIFDESFVANCQNQKMASECSAVPTELRDSVYCSAVRDGGDDVFDMILDKYGKETLQLENRKLMAALTCTRSPVLLKWILAQLLKPEKSIFRRQDCASVAAFVAGNPVGAEIVVNFLMSNWHKILKTYAEDPSILKSMIASFTSPIRSRYGLKQLEKFVEDEKATTAPHYIFRSMMQSIERKVDWLEKQGQKVADLLAKA